MALVTVSTRQGDKSIETSLTLAEAASTLAEKSRSDFALDLVAAYRRHKSLSVKQAAWLLYMAQERINADKPVEAPAVPAPAPQPEPVNVDLTGITELFKAGGSKIKFPKITLRTVEGQQVELKLAGHASRYPGAVSVSNGEKYNSGRNVFFGYIHTDGRMDLRAGVKQDVVELLKAFAADPAGVAADYGKLTGNCCFCRTALTDDRSTSVGYGPVCAKNYRLPWGAKAVKAVMH